jgi:hypothetical protein
MNASSVTIFARLKTNNHCIKVISKHKLFSILWANQDNGSVIAITPMWNYESHRNWLIRHPMLSCFTEIQLIKPKHQ